MKTIGVLGLGIIGDIWVRHYRDAGVLAGCWNRSPRPEAPNWKPTPRAVAESADALHVVVADPPAVKGVIEAMLPALGAGKLVIQSSTIDPASSATFRDRVRAAGAAYVEAPFTGSKPAAEARELVFYLGGDAVDLDRTEPLLALLSAVRLPIGTNEQAAALKLAMNLNLAVQMQSLSESLAIARRAGIGDDTFFAAMAKNAGWSGLARLKEPKLRSGDFSPQFSVKHMAKDLRLARTTAGGADLPALAMALSRLEAAEQAGLGDEDFSIVAKALSGKT
jgi:3-hydroxyisobutyrate dehydrogenase-like beta-hydroxyacid dehydrogenase